ncbi:protein moonraker isoform X4 [Myripristis murdjan]|uniref:protein moonraker isoform X4 n=1 Tax=Myripristis murdjan TaxID=586833 RepID=UPI00117633FA|nr:protein moonraker isoform X4 [Myripristis murdjan]
MMAAPLQQMGPTVEQQSPGKDRVVLGSHLSNRGTVTPGLSQTKLLFSEAMPASVCNRATRVGRPGPIVIEKLIPRLEEQENVDSSSRSSISFSALSEERLRAAVKLAKRDLRWRRHESLKKSPLKLPQEDPQLDTSSADLLQQLAATAEVKSKASSLQERAAARPEANLQIHTPQRHSASLIHENGQSPPTRDPGPRQSAGGQQPQLSQEIHKLQNQLQVYIQKIETLANRGHKMEEPEDPEEQQKMEIRRQKQEARSSRMIYGLQQQVREIQEDIEKLRCQKNQDTKKARAMDRLAAAHRGAVRAMQDFIHQPSYPSEGKVPPHYRELGQLIRQLSLCSAKVEVDQGSAVPETALDILQKLETLDSVLSKQERPQQRQAQACSSGPPHSKSPHRRMSPPSALRGPAISGLRGPRKATGPKRSNRAGKKMASQKPRSSSIQATDRREVLRVGLESLIQQREQRETHGGCKPNTTHRKEGTLHSEKSKPNQMRDAGFQQPTVSSRLRVNQIPQKEQSVPWIPTSPHSPPPPQRSPQRRRPEPRCLFSPTKPLSSPPKQRVARGLEAELLSSDKKKQAQNEALRQAWLDKMTMQRLKELNQLSKEEEERIHRLRSDLGSPSQWAERAEQKARERIQPLLDEVQISESRNRNSSSLRNRLSEQAAERAAESAEQLSEALLEDLLDDATCEAWAAKTDRQLESLAQRGLQAPTLESMLLRMEEMQRDQDEVRRRFATIAYSDPLYWDRVETTGSQCHAPGSRPASPQPIRLTRPAPRHSSAAEIVLEKPVETGISILSENSLTEEASQDGQLPRDGTLFPGPVERSRGTPISVPGSMLRSIQHYRKDYEAYLRLVAHEAVGNFNPWAIADSLADELLSEALAEVAAEFQDVVEEYAEAVFTSEFLQPVQSPPASVPTLVSQ